MTACPCRPLLACVLACALLAMSGCAEFTKCGFRGCPGDAEITAAVEAIFAQHTELEPPSLVTVRTIDHVVYLNGLVATDLQRQTAQALAQQAVGVRRVVNSIGVSYSGR